MLAPSHRRWAYAWCAVASLLLVGFSAVPATAARTAKVATDHPAARGADRSNVGATHSPQLLKQLADPASQAAGAHPGRAGPAQPAAIAAEKGVDVASYQHPNGVSINWSRVRASGIGFAGIKATEGDYYRNPYALTDLAQARASGLSVAAYAFAIPNGNGSSSNPVTQAAYLLQYLGTESRTVAIMLDIEYNPYGSECYGLSAGAMVSWISSFNAEIKARTGRQPIIYTPPAWWAICAGGSTAFGRTTHLWVPDYTISASPELAAGWKTWSIWQYSSSGTVHGIQDPGKTDLDQANPAVPPVLGQRRWLKRPAPWVSPLIRGLSPRSRPADDVLTRIPEAQRQRKPLHASRVAHRWGDADVIEQAFDRDSVRQYVEAVRGVLGSDQLRAATAAAAQVIPGDGDPQAKVSAALPGPDAGEPSSGGADGEAVPYLSRDPAVSLVQSALEGALRQQGVADEAPADHSLWSRIVHTAEALLHPGDFSPDDPDWVIKIAESMLSHLAKGNHPVQSPAGRAPDQRLGAAGRGGGLGNRAAAGAGRGRLHGRGDR